MKPTMGAQLLQAVTNRIVAGFLRSSGYHDVVVTNRDGDTSSTEDVSCRQAGRRKYIKVKPDAYYGDDPAKIRSRDLAFYRAETDAYAFESISNHMTREPGWMFSSDADDLFYYRVALTQTEEEIAALMAEPDAVFFSELQMDRDQLVILPMRDTRHWFEAHYQEYTPRPVSVGEHAAWYRLIPRGDIEGVVPGIKTVGSIFFDLAIR